VEKADLALNLKEMPFAEKIKLLSETDKAYLRGYIEKAVIDSQRSRGVRKGKRETSGGDTGSI
jgi:hypothetical protein